MRPAIVSALLLVGLALGRAGAAPRPEVSLSAATRAQISFEGLDLSDDEPKKPKPPAKKRPAAPPKSPRGNPGDLDLTVPARPAERPRTPPPAFDPPPARPAEPPAKGKPAPVMSFDAVDVSGKSAERQRLELAIKLFNDEGYEAAALAFHEVLADPRMTELHDEAQYMLAKSLYRMGMYHSALGHYKQLLAKGPASRYFKMSLEWLFFIANKTVNEQVVLEEIARHSNHEFPERFRSQFRYLLARYHFARGKALAEAGQPEESRKSFEEARRLVLMVPRSDAVYPRVRYLEATVAFQQASYAFALEGFKDVVRASNPRTNPDADPKLRTLALMQLARIHYGHRQNRYAVHYYERVSPGSDQWLEALFESSWAHFRVGQYERALGNLITLSSPFFRDEYFPEALVLKAVIYYENCRYREARAILEEFEATYLPVHAELEKLTTRAGEAQAFYDLFAEVQRRQRDGSRRSAPLLERILKLALSDRDLKAVNDSILELEAEMDSMAGKKDAFRHSPLAKGLADSLRADRAGLMGKAGLLARAKLENELGQLKELLGQALRVKFETSTKEKEFLESQLLAGANPEVVRRYSHSVAVGDERQYWPYEGEYWRDELGTYEYTLTKGCKDR